MVTRSGWRGSKRTSSYGLAERADRRLQDITNRYQEKFETALAVDGVSAWIWNKVKGTIPCSCRGFSLRDRYDISRSRQGGVAVGDVTIQNDDSYHNAKEPQSVDTKGQFVYTGEEITKQKLTGRLTENIVNETPQNKIEQPSNITLKYLNETGDYTDEEDIFDAMDNDSFPDENVSDSNNGATPYIELPLTRTSTSVMCPICLGMGTVDAWTLYGGQRIILDYSSSHPLDLDNASIEKTQPATFTVYDDSNLQWDNVRLPVLWNRLLKLNVYHRGEVVDSSKYTLYYIHPSAPNTRNVLTKNTLATLNNSLLLSNNNRLKISIVPKQSELKFTHIELLFQLNDSVYIQMPELEMADESEFADWNLNVTVEMSAKISARESSYFTESKYKRVWKITSINRKMTAAGKSFGYQVNAHALHPQEKAFTLLNVLGKPIDPFSSMVDDLLEDF